MADDFFSWAEVELPSKAAYYKGLVPPVISVRAMTIKDEQRLTGVKPEVIVPTLIQHCTKEEFDSRDLLAGDQLALLLKIRELSYGGYYEYTMSCAKCSEDFLANMEFADLKYMWYSETDGKEPFYLNLPSNGKKVELVFPRIRDEEEVANKKKIFFRNNHSGKVDPSLSNLMKIVVRTVEGMDQKTKDRYLEEGIISMDIRAIQEFLNAKMPRPVVEMQYECPSCGHSFESDLPIGKDFFRHQPRPK